MAKQKKEKVEVVQQADFVEEKNVASERGGLKKSTIVIGALLMGAAAVWGVIGYQSMSQNTGKSILGKYFQGEKKGQVVATIDGDNIYLADIKNVAEQIPQLAELPFDMIYPQLLQKYITKEIVYRSAQDSDIQNDPHVQIALKEARDTILSKAYLEKRISELATPEKLKELYQAEVKNMERQDEVHARHILVRTEKEARDVLVQLEAGADFKMLADTKSLDAENGNGGDLGYFQKNMMIPEFGEAVFALKKGQLSKPIKTPFGWHIVLVEDRRLAAPPAFEDVQEQLRQLFVERNIQNILHQEEVKHNVKVLVPTLRQPKDAAEAIKGIQSAVLDETGAKETMSDSMEPTEKSVAEDVSVPTDVSENIETQEGNVQ